MENDILKIIERCWEISSLNSFRILLGMLIGSANLLGLKFQTVSIISSFVQGEMKHESCLVGGKTCKKAINLVDRF